jgi:hypothetical protein
MQFRSGTCGDSGSFVNFPVATVMQPGTLSVVEDLSGRALLFGINQNGNATLIVCNSFASCSQPKVKFVGFEGASSPTTAAMSLTGLPQFFYTGSDGKLYQVGCSVQDCSLLSSLSPLSEKGSHPDAVMTMGGTYVSFVEQLIPKKEIYSVKVI